MNDMDTQQRARESMNMTSFSGGDADCFPNGIPLTFTGSCTLRMSEPPLSFSKHPPQQHQQHPHSPISLLLPSHISIHHNRHLKIPDSNYTLPAQSTVSSSEDAHTHPQLEPAHNGPREDESSQSNTDPPDPNIVKLFQRELTRMDENVAIASTTADPRKKERCVEKVQSLMNHVDRVFVGLGQELEEEGWARERRSRGEFGHDRMVLWGHGPGEATSVATQRFERKVEEGGRGIKAEVKVEVKIKVEPETESQRRRLGDVEGEIEEGDSKKKIKEEIREDAAETIERDAGVKVEGAESVMVKTESSETM